MNADNTVRVAPGEQVATRPLFPVSPTLAENRQLDVKPVWTSLGVDSSAFPKRLGGYSDPGESPYAGRKGLFDTAVRGVGRYADRIWMFRGGQYLGYYEKPEGKDDASPLQDVIPNWHGIPETYSDGFDAIVAGVTGYFNGYLWFFHGSEDVVYDLNTDTVIAGPRSMASAWTGMPEPFTAGIDATIHGVAQHLGVVWLFKGSEYVRFNLVTNQTEYGPASIVDNWKGWPEAFADGVDFAFYGTGARAQQINFFRGDQFFRYDLRSDQVLSDPAPVLDEWPTLGRFMPAPQLFLTEQYELTTFHGEIGRGDMVDSSIKVAGRTKTEFYVVTKRRVTEESAAATNVLESNTQKAAETFSDKVREDASTSGSRENYDYSMDASFHGELEVTGPTGGEADMEMHVKGGSQDMRRAFAKAIGHELQSQQEQSRENHKQQVSLESESHKIDEQTETGFKQIIDNSDNPDAINFVLFQLTQEYVLVLSLVDARLAFRNGDERAARSVPIREMNSLLESCLEDETARAQVARGVVTALGNVIDHATATRSLLSADSTPQSASVDASAKTKFPLLDSAGKLVRDVDVDGIVISVERPIVLTANTALDELRLPG